MENKKCLNCDELAYGKFCFNCGQKTDTHRITFKHFVVHDLVHGVWHFDKGVLFTLKQIVTRPGYAAIDYISGKRIRFYNVFYLLLIVIGLNLLMFYYNYNKEIVAEGDGIKIRNFFSKNIKLILVLLIPILAFNSWLLFKKLKFNYVEHVIIAGFAILGCHLIFLVFSLLDWIDIHTANWTGDIIMYIIMVPLLSLSFVFPAIVYAQVTKGNYKTSHRIWRILALYLLFVIEVAAALFVVLYSQVWKTE